MSEFKKETPGITRFNDHEVIVVPNRLRKAVRIVGGDERDPVADAEDALEQLSTQFESWMDDECSRLDLARQHVRAEGFTETARQNLFRAAHDIKGQGAMFGFPLAAEVADSLCRLMENSTDYSRVPLAFVDQCVDAVRAIIRERGRADATAAQLAKGLRVVADELIGAANRDQTRDKAPGPGR
jgi:chemotaxis protein histidine kinase CheA